VDDGRWRVRPLAAEDRERWRALYAAYAAFYRVGQTDEQAERTWSWLLDPAHEVEGLVVVDGSGHVAGLAHVRPFARPLSATVGGFLDDLHVEEQARGTGAVDALLQALQDLATERGWSVVRWITADDNYRARGKYDRVAVRTSWITYDMPPGRPRA
jgi:ribosomal protein S18 acetylase RimI-like enzyme